jgi:uncharacterized protein DUF2868
MRRAQATDVKRGPGEPLLCSPGRADPAAMTLSDLIDLEAQLARDRDAELASLESRDRVLLTAAPVAAPSRPSLLERWLDSLREAEPGQLHPGRAVVGVLRAMRATLVLAGLVLGWGAATALLRYTGGQPVNVWDFLLIFVALQLVLFALLLASFLFPVAALGTPLLGLFRGLFAAFYPWLARQAAGSTGARLEAWRALWHRLRSRRSLYHHVEPWILLGLTQAFGVAFNVGAILGCLRLIVFSDIAFSWSTTLLQLDAPRFHALLHAFATPFGWLWPDADPSRALVEATRYSRLEGAYLLSGAGRAARPEIVGGWWPFLLTALAFYGLLPRCLMLAVAQMRAARLLARLPFDDAEVERVVRRLSEPHVETRSPSADSATSGAAAPTPAPAVTSQGTRCTVVLWRDAPARPELQAAVARQTRCTIGSIHAAGGRDYEDGNVDWGSLANGSDSLVIVAEGWEAPDRALLRLVDQLRRAIGPRRQIVVLLAHMGDNGIRPSLASEVRIWQEGLAPLEDPYLAVEPLRGAP